MNHKPLPGIPEEISRSADRMLEQIQGGKIRKHLLGSLSRVQHSTIENIFSEVYREFSIVLSKTSNTIHIVTL